MSSRVTVFLGAYVGWFFGALSATLFAETARGRGQKDAETHLRAIGTEVERDEYLARMS